MPVIDRLAHSPTVVSESWTGSRQWSAALLMSMFAPNNVRKGGDTNLDSVVAKGGVWQHAFYGI